MTAKVELIHQPYLGTAVIVREYDNVFMLTVQQAETLLNDLKKCVEDAKNKLSKERKE